MSKYTIASVCNFRIGNEHKPGLHPSDYYIEAASPNNISVLVIGDGMHYIPQLNGKALRINVMAEEIAKAVVFDFCSASILADDIVKPGLFCVEGEFTPEEIMSDFPNEVKEARKSHIEWCKKLVKAGDDDWAENHKYKTIAEACRNAARFLGLERDWLEVKHEDVIEVKCPACKTAIDSTAIVCMNCKAVLDKKRYAELSFAS